MMRLFRIVKNCVKSNGLRWSFVYILYWFIRFFFKKDLHALYTTVIRLEEKYNLPGFNASATAGDIWDLLPWEKERGEAWTISAQWKKSLIDEVLLKYIRSQTAVLEIGPGAGRWTEILQPMARVLFTVDVSSRAIDVCKTRFPSASNILYFLTRGSHLGFILDNTIDGIWSFDVFVHINPDDTENYLSEFKRVLVPGGIAVIHHPKEGGLHGGCRSRMTARLFLDMLDKHGLNLIRQFDSWGENDTFNFFRHRDCITVFHA